MDHLISRQALKERVEEVFPDGRWLMDEPCEMFLSVIDEQPTIDAVVVVRCKDCKWWDTDGYRNGYGECPNVFCETTADWFCADGERSEE